MHKMCVKSCSMKHMEVEKINLKKKPAPGSVYTEFHFLAFQSQTTSKTY